MSHNQKTTRDLHLQRKKMWEASIANHSRYMDEATGTISTKFTEERNCPACNGIDSRLMFQKNGGFYYTCEKCKMVYLNPALKDDHLVDYYQQNHPVQGEVVFEDYDFYSKLYNQGLSKISEFIPKNGRLLDVGCSTGIFLDIAQKQGWETHGLELNRTEIEEARRKGHRIYEGLIDTVDFGHQFDAVSLWDVFEHIKDGHKFLSDVKKVLRKGGIAFIQAPSRDALSARILQSACNMFDGLEHVNLYGKDSLEIVANANGFNTVSFETVIAEIGVMNNYLDYDDPYLGHSKEKDVLAGLLTAEDILEKQLGYKFQACLQLME